MTLTMITYLLYINISIALTIGVGWILFRNGRAFLLDIFPNNETLADSINRLLLTGFYLLNIGYISLTMNIGMSIQNSEHMLEKLSYKLGIIMIVLAAIHFTNLIVLSKMRKQSTEDRSRSMFAKAS
ncbi:MAG: hypothetical protein AAF587_43955 [Bacteroidota bacterium]